MRFWRFCREYVRASALAFRRRRMEAFRQLLGVDSTTQVLDVGGTPLNWELISARPPVTLLNTRLEKAGEPGRFQFIVADARRLPFRDGAFGVVFSNSVIEHVGSRDDQRRFAEEIHRVGRSYWVQTPNRWYPVEPHLFTPLLHFLPRRIQQAVARRWTLWDWLEHPTPDRREFYVEHCLSCVRLLTAAQFKALFPGGRLMRERHWGFTKSLIMVRSAPGCGNL